MLLFFRIAEFQGLISGLDLLYGVNTNRVVVASLSSCEAAARGQRAAKLDLRTCSKFKVGRVGSAGAAQPSPRLPLQSATQPQHRHGEASYTICFFDRAWSSCFVVKVLCVVRVWSGRCLDLVLPRHDLVLHRIATFPVVDMHCNSFHGRAAVFEKGTFVWFNTLVQGAAHGEAAAMMGVVFSTRRGTANR